ncbi:MAG: 1-acyl-sn-glycerol-3-phosphate acyltransferase [Acutalibacteraceae bacterium]|nr:1-acyl-sn-glycerol-3-phosphate acyltransferase [Acutalibacteraceae bacterium]
MRNRFLEYLLDDNPEKTISKYGTIIRKIINPLVRFVVPFTTRTKLKIIRSAKMPKGPIIFCSTHSFKDDIVDAVIMAKKQTYILIGSLSQIMHSFDGISAWANGCILVNRLKKSSRIASKDKMLRALSFGSSILIFPEGTWNNSANEMTSGLFAGFYDIAVASGFPVATIATHREGKNVYGILDEAFDVTKFTREEGVKILREKMSSLRWELMEKYSKVNRSSLPYGLEADQYWGNHINSLIEEVKFWDYEGEILAKFIDKTVTEPGVAFLHLNHLVPNKNNAFLFNKRLTK